MSELTGDAAGLRIGIDGRFLQAQRAGIWRYMWEMCRGLHGALPQAEFFVYAKQSAVLPVDSPRWHLRRDAWRAARHIKNVAWLKLRAGQMVRMDHLDVYWAQDPFLPRLPMGLPAVATVYDLNYCLVPETLDPAHAWAYRLFFRSDLRRASAHVVISHGTAARLWQHAGVRAASIASPAVSTDFRAPDAEIQQVIRRKYGLHRPYLLCVATWEPRKNLRLTLQAYEILRSRGALEGVELALVGSRGWHDRGLAEAAERLGPLGVRVLGYVPDEDLPALYGACECFVFPSRYEGFGLPVLEARACGARILAADIPELREAGGSQATYVTPTIEGLLQGMEACLSGPRPAVIEADLPTWPGEAAKLARVLLDVASRRRAPSVKPGFGTVNP